MSMVAQTRTGRKTHDGTGEQGEETSFVRSASTGCVRYEDLDDILILNGEFCTKDTAVDGGLHACPPYTIDIDLFNSTGPGNSLNLDRQTKVSTSHNDLRDRRRPN
jgi:hypothetical protein